MNTTHPPVVARVTAVLPLTGLAYVESPDGREWAITKSTQGGALADLAEGRLVKLHLERLGAADVVRRYEPAAEQA